MHLQATPQYGTAAVMRAHNSRQHDEQTFTRPATSALKHCFMACSLAGPWSQSPCLRPSTALSCVVWGEKELLSTGCALAARSPMPHDSCCMPGAGVLRAALHHQYYLARLAPATWVLPELLADSYTQGCLPLPVWLKASLMSREAGGPSIGQPFSHQLSLAAQTPWMILAHDSDVNSMQAQHVGIAWNQP
jgi:hypothetical protein